MTIRRKSTQAPLAIIRSSLTCRPIATFVMPEADTFSDVLVKAISAPQSVAQSINWAHEYQDVAEASEASSGARPQKESVSSVTSWSPYSNTTTDLYVQLDTLLRNKSLLIGIA
jgi:hypothetical protein